MGGESVVSAATKEQQAVEVLEDAKFNLHKWHSNASTLEGDDLPCAHDQDELSFAKQQLGSNECETKILGVSWNKVGHSERSC